MSSLEYLLQPRDSDEFLNPIVAKTQANHGLGLN